MRFPWSRPVSPALSPDTELLAQLAALELRVAELEEERAELELEWSSWHEKFSTLYARLAKRDKRDAAANGDGAQVEAPAPMSIGASRLLQLGAK
jgi:hypothetical protein